MEYCSDYRGRECPMTCNYAIKMIKKESTLQNLVKKESLLEKIFKRNSSKLVF